MPFTEPKITRIGPLLEIASIRSSPPTAAYISIRYNVFFFVEQLVNPGEEVDLPILFYLDPEFDTDSRTHYIDDVTLSYVFFESDSGIPEEYEKLQRLRNLQKEKNRLRGKVPGSKVKAA